MNGLDMARFIVQSGADVNGWAKIESREVEVWLPVADNLRRDKDPRFRDAEQWDFYLFQAATPVARAVAFDDKDMVVSKVCIEDIL